MIFTKLHTFVNPHNSSKFIIDAIQFSPRYCENTSDTLLRHSAARNVFLHLRRPCRSGTPLNRNNFFGMPSLKWDGSTVNGARQEKSTLEFSTTEKLPEGEPLAFVVTVASGKQYLVGAREPKYPLINYSETTGAPDGDAALRSYKITHVAQKSVLPCVL